ncbi:MAG: hypothetical protein KAT68_03510 [Bacteroidales bacterium]|nr:hypothetical protein [Bacteroidales bacterium]
MTYKLKIVNGFRVVFLFTAYTLIILFSIIASLKLDIITLKLIIIFGTILIFGLFFYYLCVGEMIVVTDNNNLTLKWIKKPLFDYRKLTSIPINGIRTIVIDQDQIIRKIYFQSEKIRLNTWKPDSIFKDDVKEFLKYLHSIEKENENIRIIDSWDEWFEKGYLKIALWINSSIIILGTMLIAYAWIFIEFKPMHLFYLIFLIPQLLIYQMTIKAKMRKQTGCNSCSNSSEV